MQGIFYFVKRREGMDKNKCKECIWKTVPAEGVIVCAFPNCIYRLNSKLKG